MRKIFIIGAAACLFTACKPSVSVSTKLTQGTADFSTYLAIGNSLTAGYADGSLTVSGQLNSYPQRLYEQFQLVSTIKTNFVQPLVTGNGGYPGPKLVLAMTHSLCTTDSSLGPVNYSGPIDSLGSSHFVSTVNNGQINNIGVPGIRAVDYLVSNYAFNYNAYAARFYYSLSGTPLDELAYRVHNLHPTFFTMWLGANDVLGYATHGGRGDGSGKAQPIVAGTYVFNPEDISDYAHFDTAYDKAVNMAISTGAQGALINIPDITSLPFFTTIPIGGLVLTRQGQADTLQALWGKGSVLSKVFQVGANNYIIEQHDGQVRQAAPGELLLLTVPADSIRCAGWGSIKPIPRDYVITTDELRNIQLAIDAFNSFIKYEASIHTQLAYVDMNAYMKSISAGYTYNGITYTTSYITGGAFSLDGVHPTQRGYALIANEILRTINTKYKSNIPLLDVNRYHGIDFP
jgi:lysophospholipase L1-like esterase